MNTTYIIVLDAVQAFVTLLACAFVQILCHDVGHILLSGWHLNHGGSKLQGGSVGTIRSGKLTTWRRVLAILIFEDRKEGSSVLLFLSLRWRAEQHWRLTLIIHACSLAVGRILLWYSLNKAKHQVVCIIALSLLNVLGPSLTEVRLGEGAFARA